MKKLLAFILAALTLISAAACAPKTEAADTARSWVEKRIEENKLFSFDYNGEEYDSFIGKWEKKVEKGDNSWTLTYTAPEGVTARAEISLDTEFDALEWCCYFENTASGDSPAISNIRAMRSDVKIDGAVLTAANGSDATAADFEPFEVDLTKESEYSMKSSGGRSSQGGFPYFDVTGTTGGIIGAIGWTGNWSCDFSYENGSVSVSAGMTNTDIALHAGESMRTPAMLLLFFEGDNDAGHNSLRRLVLKSYTPSDATGKPVMHLPLTLNYWGGTGAQGLIATVENAARIGIDYDTLWVDAGWYGPVRSTGNYDGIWYNQVGDWYCNEEAYPDGFKPVSDALAKEGKNLLVWFEPERAIAGTQLISEHPEYFFEGSDSSMFELYNFANDEAVDYIIELIGSLIEENGISWYRQDFNCEPTSKWFTADTREGEHRTGITEIKYITNLYRYIDALEERVPGLMMDNCASGGRRLDFEMMRRSVPLWRTDYTVTAANNSSDCEGVRNIGYNLAWWLPLSCGGAGASDGISTTYAWRCQQSSGVTMGLSGYNPDWISQYLRCRELMTGDYYILSAGRETEFTSVNAIYEFYVPEKGEGYIMAFRPSRSDGAEESYALKGLKPEATYTIESADYGESLVLTGEQLMSTGLKIALPAAQSSQLIFITEN